MAQYIELNMDQGAEFSVDIDLKDNDGTPQNVAANTFTCQMRKSFYSANATANLTMTIRDATNGNVTLSLDSANTANIRAGRYLFDVKQVTASNSKTRILEGIITVTPQVTR